MSKNSGVSWWRVVAAVGLFGLAAVFIADQFVEEATDYVLMLALVLLGLAFMWAFYARGVFWAVAPGVGLLAVVVAGIVTYFAPENNGWIATLILGAAAYIIGAIPNPRGEIKIAYLIGGMILVIGFLLAPMAVAVKVVLSAVTVIVTIFLLWRYRETLSQA
jgi:hypothetical protein